MRYRARSLSLEAAGDIEGFVGAPPARVGAAGGELSEMFDYDLSL
jgi:hypothetical protein